MPDPNVIAEGLTDMDTWLTGTLTPAVSAINNDLTAYQVSIFAWRWLLHDHDLTAHVVSSCCDGGSSYIQDSHAPAYAQPARI